MQLFELLNTLNEYAPFQLQESYDNSGLLIGDAQNTISKALICVDVTEDVMDEAINDNCDVVISHHPLIFNGLKSISNQTSASRAIIKAIKNDIAILAVHTNIDNAFHGVNNKLAAKLSLENLKILSPKKDVLKKLVVFCPNEYADIVRNALFEAGAGNIGDYDSCSYNIQGQGSFRAHEGSNPFVGEVNKLHFESEIRIETVFPAFLQKMIIASMLKAHPYEEVAYDIYPLENDFEKAGAGMIGDLKKPMSDIDFLKMVKKNLVVPVLRHSGLRKKAISKVAVCGGSGSSFIDKAVRAGADAFVTGDVKYHQFLDSANSILLVDAGHFETEQFTSEIIYDIISKKFTNFALQISNRQSNAVCYF